MSTEESILKRLEILEKQNCRMKRIGIAVIIVAASLLLMGQKAAVNRTIEANEYILRDSNGTMRSKWFMTKEGPALNFLDSNGKERVNLYFRANEGPGIKLAGPNDRKDGTPDGITLLGSLASLGPQIFLNHAGRSIGLMIPSPWGSTLIFEGQEGRSVRVDASRNPYIEITDKEGFSTKVGSADLITERTGEIRQSSAASVTLFSKDNKVLWKAP